MTAPDTPPVASLTAEQKAELRRLAEAATPGPWLDLTTIYFERMKDYRKRTRKWWHGTQADSLPVVLIVSALVRGERVNPEDIPQRVDYWDLNRVISWRWGMLPRRTESIGEGFFSPEDAAFVTASREAVPALLAEVERLEAALAEAHAALGLAPVAGATK